MWFKEKKYAWFILIFLWIFGFVNSLSRFISAYYQPEIANFLHVGRGFLGFTWSTSIFIGAICAPLGGWLTDRYGYKKVLIASGALGTLATTLFLFIQNPIGYYCGFGLLSGLAGIGASTGYILINNWFTHHRAKALVILGSAGSLGLAIITPIFVSNKTWLGWNNAYWILFTTGCIFIPLAILFIRDNISKPASIQADEIAAEKPIVPDKPALSKLQAFKQYLKNPTLVTVIFALFTCGFSMGTVEMHLMAIQQQAHVHDMMFTSSLSTLGVLELIGGLTFSFLLDRMRRTLALSALYTLRVVAFTLLIFHFQASPILFSVIFGASYLGAVPGGILVANEELKASNHSMGLQTGLLILVHQLGGVAAAIGGGLNFDIFHNYQLLIAINIAMSLISAIGYYYVSKRRSQPA
ncbi:MFS transporter [Paenibacillus psychroresistens]|uniref:MFS transporter n=1 Tax=Paenibacillus psychroresistens TaxID=1778678 RepID=A0A6B8REE5_9BACL|nr:MFS transporter [Paenibacillus psychroresistens]QGQ94094.1 MFS transporter [Paenibacillus psychroresistens]